ncbi:mitotic checkpoint serine/threonine-protein kinase BUB1 beta isoform X3 [Gambusia affinis]|uniref:mitotic checkpoint serine/threonine-protein kinase BUB1 beta isoform X3 n=1 Tax=Gambusia affinis TaxID=33528 RepID=UPI001CDD856E|nr:mitotic checkpoint serine/threonine-protein kinase BUB1 beta isoform X3 [Gambusia affinis]
MEGLSVSSQSANESTVQVEAGLQDGGGASLWSPYCNEDLMRGGEELCFEELRAERYNQQKQKEMEEKMRHLKEQQEQLSQELEEKKRLLLRKSQQISNVDQPAAALFRILDESGSVESAGKSAPSSDELPDDVFLRPDEKGLCVRVQFPTRPDQNQQQNQPPAVDPCDPEVRRRLLERFDITSSPNLHPEQRPLPAVEECSILDLGGDTFFIRSRLLDRGSVSIFRAAAENQSVFIKVERCSAPWDFYLFTRLKENSPSADRPALISCFLFEDGCITVYRLPGDLQLTVLADCGLDPVCVGVKAVRLLELVLQLHRRSLLHAGLRPGILASCGTVATRDWLFPLDWSSSLDLDLQKEVRTVQQIPSAQAYLRLGLLQPADPPHTVDLVGVAETIYFLLTNSEMKPEKHGSSWTVELDVFPPTWRRFFCSLLNAGGRSSISILSELKDELSKFYL